MLPRLVYIAGYGRSGSTLLEILIGNLHNVQNVGELANIFEYWHDANQKCSCGQAMTSCDFWNSVCEAYLTELGSIDETYLRRDMQRAVEERRSFYSSFFRLNKQKLHSQYIQQQRALFKAIASQSKKEIVVDSSKTARLTAWRPYALCRIAGFEVNVIHLIRDIRGVIYSMMKGSNTKMENGEVNFSLRFAMIRALYGWTMANLVMNYQSSLLPSGSVIRVHYEDVIKNPKNELIRIGDFLGVDPTNIINKLEKKEILSGGHCFSGNRLRHVGVSRITKEEQWRTEAPKKLHVFYWTLGWPLHVLFYKRGICKGQSL